MKIDCPHCGVHGSVDDSQAGKKLRCPKCRKVFLISEDLLPNVEDITLVRQEILRTEVDIPVDTIELPESMEAESLPGLDGSLSLEDDLEATDVEDIERCVGCDQAFDTTFLVDIKGKSYCSHCRTEAEMQELESDADNEILHLLEEVEETLLDDHDSEETALEKCDGCGEALHPAFLEIVEGLRLCALCLPEDFEDEEVLETKNFTRERSEEDTTYNPKEVEQSLAEMESELNEIAKPSEQNLMEEDSEEELLDEEGLPQKACSVCGDFFHPDFLQKIESMFYCGICQPEVVEIITEDPAEEHPQGDAFESDTLASAQLSDDEAVDNSVEEQEVMAAVADTDESEEESTPVADEEESTHVSASDFTVGNLLKEAWQKTKGVKGAVWCAVIVMSIVFCVMAGAVWFFLAPIVVQTEDLRMLGGISAAALAFISWLGMLFAAGLILIGVRRALGQRVSWKMLFAGFAKWFSITVALLLQLVLVTIGFALLAIPGIYLSVSYAKILLFIYLSVAYALVLLLIYLSVAYALVLPLIVEKGLGPWEALETSRKAVHKKWWTVFGVYSVMGLLFQVAVIPLGLGLIWTVPMFFVVIGVLYSRLFESTAEPADEDVAAVDTGAEELGEQERVWEDYETDEADSAEYVEVTIEEHDETGEEIIAESEEKV